MKLSILPFFAATALAFFNPAPVYGETVRLALISESEDTSAVSDVLTADLSKEEGIQLLERNEIDRVYREQALSAQNTDYIKLGRILGADGLLIMHLSKETNPHQLSLRLVAVKPGITLFEREYPWPLDNQVEWAHLVVAQCQPFFLKLVVLPGEALPVSILNLRSAVASSQEETTERELTALLYARLISEKDVFVLERRRLELLREENQLNNSENTFWSGGYLLEGVIDKAGYQKDTVTIEARLTPPDKKGILSVEVSGARTNLPVVVNDLVAKILAVLKKQSSQTEWNPQAEADQYFAEGQWMLKWGMFQEAKSASDAAWALGRHNEETAKLRIKSYMASAGDPGICVVINETKHVLFGQRVNPNVYDMSQIASYGSAPAPEHFRDMVRAEELFLETFQSFASTDKKLDSGWLNLGSDILDRTSWWLRYYYFTAEARPGQEAKIEEARKLCLTIANVVESHVDFTDNDTNAWLNLKARHLAFWADTPEQCLPFYHNLIETDKWPLVRKRFFNTAYVETSVQLENQGHARTVVSGGSGSLVNPGLVGWTWADRQRCPAVWNHFIDELCASSKPLTCLEGKILRCSYSWSEADFEQNLNELFDYARQQHQIIVAAGLGGQLMDDLNTLIQQRAEFLTKDRRQRIQEQLWPEFQQDFSTWIQEQEQVKAEQSRQAWLEEKKDYLNSQTNFDFVSFSDIILFADFNQEEIRELLPLLTNFEARINNNRAGDDDRLAMVRRRQMESMIGSLKMRLNNSISTPAPKKSVRPSASQIESTAPAPTAVVASNHVDIATATAAASEIAAPVNIVRFWKVPTLEGLVTNDSGDVTYFYSYSDSIDDYVPQVVSSRYRDGKLWVEVRYDSYGDEGRADFFSIDLETFAADKIQYEGEKFSLPNLLDRNNSSAFEEYDGFFYLLTGNAVRKYSFGSQHWEQFHVPSGKAIPVRLGNRLFFTSSSSILEYAADGSFHTLASSRREPPVGLLDKIDNYGMPRLFLTKDNVLDVCIGNQIYAYSTKTNDWFGIAALPPVDESNFHPFDNGFITQSGNSPGIWLGMFGDMSSPENLFRQPWRKGTLIYESVLAKKISTHWKAEIPGIEFCQQSNSLWFLTGAPKLQADAALNLQAINLTNTALVCFTLDEKEPITIPVRFVSDDIPLARRASGMLANSSMPPWKPQWKLQWTPQGLVMIACAPVPGFWFIPGKDLQTAVERVRSERRSKQAALDALREQRWKDLFAAYDKNHDNSFEPDEREEMIDDARYLELELPVIDANTNNLLDAAELEFFDANTNRILDPKEQKAIETTLSLMAERLTKDLPPGSEHKISPGELPPELFSSNNSPGPFGSIRRDSHGNPVITNEELVTKLRSYLACSLQPDEKPGFSPVSPGMRSGEQPLFKAHIEKYWGRSRLQFDTGSTISSQP